MNDNKRIGFDVLENADNNKINEMGADSPIISKSAHDRMLEMSKRKYNNAKAHGSQNITFNTNDDYTVSGPAEKYNRSPVKRIITVAASCAAAAVIISTSALLLFKKPTPHTPAPNSEVVTSPITSTNDSASGSTSTATSAKTGTTQTTTVTTYVAKDFNIPENVSQDDIAAARERVLDRFVRTEPYAVDIQYKSIDLNHDNVPELMMLYQNAYYAVKIYRYNGSEYVTDINENGFEEVFSCTSIPAINADESCLYLLNREGGTRHTYISMNSDYSLNINSLTDFLEWDENYGQSGNSDNNPREVFRRNGVVITESEYRSLLSEYSSENYSEMTGFTFVANESVPHAEEMQRISDEEQQHEEYRKTHPHCDNFAGIAIDPAYLEQKGLFDRSSKYTVEYTAEYCDGTTSQDVVNEAPNGYDSDLEKEVFSICISYGENDYAPCHVKIRCTKNTEQNYFEVADMYIDFRNRSWTVSDNDLAQYIKVEYYYPSDYTNSN